MSPRRWRGIVPAAVLVVITAGCGEDNSAAPGPGDLDVPPVDGATVRVLDFEYEPDDVVVRPGEAVAFTNEGETDHTVTADEGEFDSGEQRPGETFRFLTDGTTPEEIAYHCELHPDEMQGRIVVDPAGAEES